jgi:hypothetical protein
VNPGKHLQAPSRLGGFIRNSSTLHPRIIGTCFSIDAGEEAPLPGVGTEGASMETNGS